MHFFVCEFSFCHNLSGGVAGLLDSGGALHHLELAGVVVAGGHGEVRVSARARGNLGAYGLARVCEGGPREGREGGGVEGLLVQQGVHHSRDRRRHGLARAGRVQLAGAQLLQLQLGGHGGGGRRGGLAGGVHRQVAQL